MLIRWLGDINEVVQTFGYGLGDMVWWLQSTSQEYHVGGDKVQVISNSQSYLPNNKMMIKT